MGEIKSALERALERAAKIEVEEGKLQELKYIPEGEKIAALFLKDEDIDLVAQIDKFPEEVRAYVLKGVSGVLLGNINLPHNERQRQTNRRALQGLKLLKRDKSLFSHIVNRMESLFAKYERERQELYERLRAEFEEKLREALAQQGIKLTAPIQVERYPEFQHKWQEFSLQFNQEYERHLTILRSELDRLK